MEKNQYRLCTEILTRLDGEGVLENVVLVGSWCVYFYQGFFEPGKFLPTIRTRDLDILIPAPFKLDHEVDVFELVKDLGFVLDFRRPDGYMKLMHPELILSFSFPRRDAPGVSLSIYRSLESMPNR